MEKGMEDVGKEQVKEQKEAGKEKKSAPEGRVAAREIAVHLVFEMVFNGTPAAELLEQELNAETFAFRSSAEPMYEKYPGTGQLKYIRDVVTNVWEHRDELDQAITRHAKGWRLNRIDRVAAAIMRVSMCEMLYIPDVPVGASINEAVEIAKGYLDPDVVRFLNGILGSFSREQFPDLEAEKKRRRALAEQKRAAEAAAAAAEQAAAKQSEAEPAPEAGAAAEAPKEDKKAASAEGAEDNAGDAV